jgi:hypothetical protein
VSADLPTFMIDMPWINHCDCWDRGQRCCQCGSSGRISNAVRCTATQQHDNVCRRIKRYAFIEPELTVKRAKFHDGWAVCCALSSKEFVICDSIERAMELLS